MPIATKIPGGNELLDPQKLLKEIGVTQGMKVGDLGCGGRGFFSLQAAKMVGQSGLVYAVDILKPVLKSVVNEARSMGIYNIKPVWSNLEVVGATKIKEGEIDIALVNNLLFQVKENRNVIREAKRLLKPEGKLMVVDWKKTDIPFGPPVEMRVSPEEVKKLAEKEGFELEKEFEAGTYHYGLIFKKT